jgi:pseudouridine synthase
VRLNRLLALAGVASRRACDEIIAAGRVSVGGQVVTDLGHRVVAAAAATTTGAAGKSSSNTGRPGKPAPTATTTAAAAAPQVLVDGKPVAIGPALAALSGGGAAGAASAPAARGNASSSSSSSSSSGPFYYFAVNKPKGYVCSAVSPSPGQTPAVELLRPWLDDWERRARREAAREAAAVAAAAASPSAAGRRAPRNNNNDAALAPSTPSLLPPRLFTVGRLDVATTGLLLVTNDGAWAQSVMHPSAGGLTREYVATLRKPATSAQLESLATEGAIVDGARVVPLAVWSERVGQGGGRGSGGGGRPAVRVVVGEGRNREVRKLVEAAGLDLHALKRVRVGGYRMPSSLGLGGWLELGAEARAAVMRDPEAAAAREARQRQQHQGSVAEAAGRGGGGMTTSSGAPALGSLARGSRQRGGGSRGGGGY